MLRKRVCRVNGSDGLQDRHQSYINELFTYADAKYSITLITRLTAGYCLQLVSATVLLAVNFQKHHHEKYGKLGIRCKKFSR